MWWRVLNAAVALLLAAGLPVAPAPERPCAANPLCSCSRGHMSCAGVPLRSLPPLPAAGTLHHVDVSLARLEVLPESALDRLPLRTLVLVAAGLSRLQPRSLLSMATTLASLDLGYNELAAVPLAALQDLKVLNWLNLQNNYIAELDPNMDWSFLSESLIVLSMSNNDVCELRSGALSRLKHLAQLDLEDNRIRHLAADSLPASLQLLRLSDNLVHALSCDTLARLPRLRHLHLRNNALRQARDTRDTRDPPTKCRFNRTKRIDTLDLSHNELNDDIQLDVFREVQIKQLILDTNDLTEVPYFVLESGRLEMLSISFNKLTELPNFVFESLKHDLRQLELDHNALATSPTSFDACSRLRHLSLAYNLLRELRSIPPYLHSLSLAGNYLNSFPNVLKSLTPGALGYLDLSYNLIAQLSAGDFDDWSGSLSTLNLKGNRLTQLHAGLFPAAMPAREMILSFNDLYHISPDTFANLTSTLRLLEFSSTLFSGEFPATTQLDNLSWISYDNNNIHMITATDVQTYPSLQYLNLEYNKIIEFPTEAVSSNVSHALKDLRLSYNIISKINSIFLTDMLQLHSVDVSYNRVQNLSERSFTDLPNLAYLSLAGNLINSISERTFYNLPKLQVLDLHDNHLKEFSTNYFVNVSNEEINFSLNISCNSISYMFGRALVPLNIVDLSHNLMSYVPKSFFSSLGPHARQIVLSHNKLTQLENTAFGSLPNLVILSLSSNNITAVKRRAFSELSSLQILDLSDNLIAQLSVEQFCNMKHLRYLKLNNNRLRSLPRDVFRNTILEHMDLGQNEIAAFPSVALSQVGFTLRYLDLSHNAVRYLDASMFQSFSFLLDLSLAHNSLTLLADNTFASLARLRKLNLSFNSIEANFKELFHNLQNLRSLDIANVGLRSVPYLPLANLTYLNLASNYISSYRDSDMKMFKEVRVLNLSYNRMTSMRPGLWAALKKLRVLDISHNPLISITQSTFKGLESLFHLYIKGLKFVEVIERKSFRHLLSLRTLDIDLLSRGSQGQGQGQGYDHGQSQGKFLLADIVASVPNIERLVVGVEQARLTDQLRGANATKLRYLEIHGEKLEYISEDAFEGMERLHQLHLKITGTSLTELPHGFMKHLAQIPHLGLDLSHNRLTALSPAAFYPNITSWSHVATKLLSGGLVLAGNPLRCGCDVAWLGAWLRRWAAESAGAAAGAAAAAGAGGARCERGGGARPLPLLQLDADEAECHASALSSRAPPPPPAHRPHRAWVVLLCALRTLPSVAM